MTTISRTRFRGVAAAILGLALGLGAVAALPQPAEAHGVRVGLFVGVPFYAPPPYYYYPPPYYYYAPPPPPVVYAPPPVVYTQPAPAVVANPASAPYTAASGQTCREYQANVTVNGVLQQSYGTACLQPDGTWRIVN